MICEVAILNVIPGKEENFLQAFRQARPLIAATPGFQSIQLQRSIENPNRFLLLVQWKTLEDHTVGFRQSDRYVQWRKLLHHFYDPFPVVEHYREALEL